MSAPGPEAEGADGLSAARRGALAGVTVVGVASAVATSRLLRSPVVLPLGVLSAVVASACALLADRRGRTPTPLLVAATLGGLAAWAAAASVAVGPDPLGGVAGVFGAWPDLLTTGLPAEVEAGRLGALLALPWLGAGWGTVLVLRRRRVVAGLVPPLLALLAGLLVGAGRPAPSILVAAVALAGCATVLVLGGDRPPVRGADVAIPAAVAAAAGLLAALVVPVAIGDPTPRDPRRLVPVQLARDAAVSPLTLVPALRDEPDTVLFRTRGAAPQRWQLVVLDRFDGAEWRSSGGFTTNGTVLTLDDPALGARTPTTTTEVTVERLPGVWLPTSGRPDRLEGAGIALDPSSGVVIARGRRTEGTTYRVRGTERPVLDDATAPGSGAAPADEERARLDAAVDLPDGRAPRPPEVEALARERLGATADPLAAAQSLRRLLLEPPFVNRVEADPGHSYAHLARFLTESRTGTSEQFATAYAVLARMVGLPSRVVVGFTSGADDAERPGDRLVRGSDARAWAEVHLAGLGWLTVDPTPAETTGGRNRPVTTTTTSPVRPTSPTTAVPDEPAAPEVVAQDGGPSVLVLGAAGLAVVVLGTALSPLARKARRRARRRTLADAGARTQAAWAEVADRCIDRRLVPGRSVDEVLAALDDLASGRLRELGALADRAAFSREALGAELADRAWEHVEVVLDDLDEASSSAARVRAALSWRSLVRAGS